MGKIFKFVSGLAITGGALAALTYHLQKKGVVNIEVNYDDEEGNPVTKPIDQIVDENVDKLKTKASAAMGDLSDKAVSMAQGVKQTAKEQFDNLSNQLRKGKESVVEFAEDAADEVKEEVAEDFCEVAEKLEETAEKIDQ